MCRRRTAGHCAAPAASVETRGIGATRKPALLVNNHLRLYLMSCSNPARCRAARKLRRRVRPRRQSCGSMCRRSWSTLSSLHSWQGVTQRHAGRSRTSMFSACFLIQAMMPQIAEPSLDRRQRIDGLHENRDGGPAPSTKRQIRRRLGIEAQQPRSGHAAKHVSCSAPPARQKTSRQSRATGNARAT